MRKSIMLIAAMMMSTVIFAQHPGKDSIRHRMHRGEQMKTVLSLNDTQYATIKGINKKYAARQFELRKDSAKARDEKFKEAKALRQEKEKEINAVLTPEQQNKWKAYRAARQEKIKAQRQEAAEKHAVRIKTLLSLSDDQLAKLQTVNKEYREKFENLFHEHKDSGSDRSEFKKLKAEHDAAIKNILTEEQFRKWTALKEERQGRFHHKHDRRAK